MPFARESKITAKRSLENVQTLKTKERPAWGTFWAHGRASLRPNMPPRFLHRPPYGPAARGVGGPPRTRIHPRAGMEAHQEPGEDEPNPWPLRVSVHLLRQSPGHSRAQPGATAGSKARWRQTHSSLEPRRRACFWEAPHFRFCHGSLLQGPLARLNVGLVPGSTKPPLRGEPRGGKLQLRASPAVTGPFFQHLAGPARSGAPRPQCLSRQAGV